MTLNEVLYEDLEIKSGDKSLDNLFKNSLSMVFSPSFLKRINQAFKTSIKLKQFNQRTNIMCYTIGTNIYINIPMFKSTPRNKALNYLLHELIHVLMNTKLFPELKQLQNELVKVIEKNIDKGKETDFLTGKHQDIHSNWRGEVINYLFNNSINWKISPNIQKEYYDKLENSEVFNLDSSFWKKRFN